MNEFYLSRKISARLSLRAAVRMFCILTLALWGPAMAGAQAQPQPLDVASTSITDKLTLTYKPKTAGSTDYAWFYKIGTNGTDTEFSGTLTGTNANWQQGAINIKSEKAIADANNLDSYPILKLDGLNLTSTTADGSLFYLEGSKPFCIQATGNSASNLKAKKDVINNYQGCILLLDGGTAGLNIAAEGTGSYGIYLYSTSSAINSTLKGKITVTAEAVAVFLDNRSAFSATEDAKVTVSSEDKDGDAIYGSSRVKSPFLQWQFATAPTSGQTLEVKDASGQSFDPAIQFTTDSKKKGFAINVTKNTGYTLWLGNEQLMDSKGTTVFTATEDKLVSFSGMTTLPADWPEYAKLANVGPTGTDVAVSGTTYTVKTACGLAWIAWVTNNGKTIADADKTYTDSYPASEGFKDCTVTLADDISLAKPAQGVASGFEANWIPIGTYKGFDARYYFQGTFDGGGHTITGMTISSASFYYIGLFGYLYGATVRNLTMAGSDNINLTTIANAQDTAYYLGCVAGYVKNGKIINCHNQCNVSFSVTGNSGSLGGIAGYSEGSVISACSNRGAVTITGKMGRGGGIVATNNGSSIVSCFNTEDIRVTATGSGSSDAAYAGGIGAYSSGNCSISHCYSTGWIIAKSSAANAYSGGIAGLSEKTTIESCFATGAVSAGSNSDSRIAAAGGIVGQAFAGNINITIKNCLALTTAGVKALGNTSDKQAGRIVGSDPPTNKVTLLDNYASTMIQLTIGDNTLAVPTDNIGSDKANGADTYLDDVAAEIAAWAGPENTQAFTAIGTAENGLLPQLKAIAGYGADGLPTAYASTIIPGQSGLSSASYLRSLLSLPLSSSDTMTFMLFYSNNKWSYKKGAGTETRFNGKISSPPGPSANKLIVATATGNPTLTLNYVTIRPTDGAALTVNEGCDLTIAQTGSILGLSGASTLINKGTLRLSGSSFRIENSSSSDMHYCLDNSGTFSVLDPVNGYTTFHCAHTAIHNTGTLTNAWMECLFTDEAGDAGATIRFLPRSSQPIEVKRYNKTLATTVTAGEEYKLWEMKASTFIPQKGFDSEGTAIDRFPAPEADGRVTTFTEVSDWKEVEISGNQNLSEAGLSQSVIVKSDGVLTVDSENASVFELTLEEGAQVVTTNALKVSKTFKTNRSLNNKWTTFGSPIELTASAEYGSGLILYAATGYTAKEAVAQGWEEVSVLYGKRVDLTAGSPYLLAADAALTRVTFSQTASDAPIEIPATATVASGDALENGVFLFRTNPNLANLTLRGIYVLNAEGTRFDLQEADYVLKPFEAYITANAVTRSLVRSVGVCDGSVVTANEIATATAAVRIWAADGALHVYSGEAAALTVVRSDGRTVYAASIAPGDTRLALPSGIYMIRINNITYKIAL